MAERKQLLGPDGLPVSSGATGDDLLRELVDMGVKSAIRDRGSYVEIDKETLTRLYREKARSHSMTSVPSTPRNLIREVGGGAVGRGYGRWPHVTFEMLRNVRERASILAPIHQARQYQVRRMAVRWPGQKGKVGFRVVHKDHYELDSIPPEGFQKWIDRFEEVFWTPTTEYGTTTLGDALTLLEEDLLTINRPVVELIPSFYNRRRIVQYRPVDGGIIWPTLRYVEKWMADNPRWSVGYDKGRIPDVDMLDAVSAAVDHDLHGKEYVLVREGIVEAVYPKGRLIVAPIQNRTDIRYVGYPPSHVEQALALISAFMNAFEYNASYFTKGMLAEFILGLPADMHDDDVDAFLDMFREASQGVRRAHQPPVLPLPPGGKDAIAKIDLKSSNKEMMYEVFISLCMSLSAAVYRMAMDPLNAKPWDGGQGPKMNEPNRTEEIALAKEEGLQGDLNHLNDHIFTPMAKGCHPDLRVVIEYGDYDPHREAELYDIRTKSTMSINEARVEQGQLPRGFWLKDEEYDKLDPEDEKRQKHDQNPWNWPRDPTFAGAINNAAQLEQQEKMAQMGMAQPGDPNDPSEGEDDGFGGRDDGFGGSHPANGPPNPYGNPAGGNGAPQAGPMNKAARTVHLHLHTDNDLGSYEP